MPSIEVRKKDLQEYNTNLVKANKKYATELDQYVNGLILPMVSDFTDIISPEDKVLTSGFRRCLLDAVEFAYTMWRLQAHFQGIRINLVNAYGAPGCLTGPQVDAYIRMAPSVAPLQGIQEEIVQAVAEGFSAQFAQWQGQVTVPGLPMYPSFAAVPAPFAPPTPNVPMPLLACESDKLSGLLTDWEMQSAIEQHLTSSHKKLDQYDTFIYGLCLKLCLLSMTKLSTTRVSYMLGTGPVQGFTAWPVRAGQVMGGWIIPSGTHLAT